MLYLALYTGMFSVARWDSRCRYTYTVVPCPCTLAIWRSPLKYLNRYLIIKVSKIFITMSKIMKTSLPYFRVKLSCVCLMFAERKK